MNIINQKLIAPCGMNCAICAAHLRKNNQCPGCRADDKNKSKSCIHCKIKNCQKRTGKFCFDCIDFPCERLKKLDVRYQKNYHMSEINPEFEPEDKLKISQNDDGITTTYTSKVSVV